VRRLALLAALCLALASQVGAVFRQNVSWDEFALLALADTTATSGELHAAGRPGLAVWLLVPLVSGCDDEIAVVQRARLLWTGITALFLIGLALWIAELEPLPSRRGVTALLGVSLLALVPAFLWASVQVRTDQLGLAGAALGGWLLLVSRRRPWLALAAGACFGIGFLGSQKSLYLVALALLLAAGQLRLERELAPRREGARGCLAAAGFAAVLLAFEAAVAAAFRAPEGAATRTGMSRAFVESGLSLFEFYRHTIGLREYREMAPTLVPHALALAALAVATPAALRRGGRRADQALLAWAVLCLGVGVALFHAAAFRYFWMTLGVFPAVAIALARGELREVLPGQGRLPPAWAPAATLGFAALLAIPAVFEAAARLRDTQAVQRESFAFLHRDFAPTDAGFQPESALFCQAGRQPIPTQLSQHIYWRFAGSARERNAADLLETFRAVPIQFLVESFRLNQFPVEVRRFWAENYQPYRASVFVAGRRLAGPSGAELAFEILVPGPYRWLPGGGAHPLSLEGHTLAAGEVVELAAGRYSARLLEDVPDGMLVLAVDDPPGPAPLPFYEN
jgi:hypothetical protein